MYPNFSLLDPIIAQCSMLVSAVFYYSNNMKRYDICSDAAIAIRITIELIENKNSQDNLAFISYTIILIYLFWIFT